jgi:hypothetical protein
VLYALHELLVRHMREWFCNESNGKDPFKFQVVTLGHTKTIHIIVNEYERQDRIVEQKKKFENA